MSSRVIESKNIYDAGFHEFYTYGTGALASNIGLFNSIQTMTIKNGNVGIGTANPTQKLHIEGNIFAKGNLTCSNISVIGDFVTLNTITSNTEQVVVENAGTGPALKVTQTGNNSVAEFYDKESGLAMIVGNNGNIGIGTNNPMAKLHIAGSLSNMVVDSRGYVGIGTMNPVTPFHMITNNNNVVINTNGNVGIGTNMPTHNFQVNGNANIFGILQCKVPTFNATVPIMTFTAYVKAILTLNTPTIDNINGKVGNTYRPSIPGVYLVYGFFMFDKPAGMIELGIEYNGVTALTNLSSGQSAFNPSSTIVGIFYFNGTTDNTNLRVITNLNGSMYGGQLAVTYLSSS